MSHTRHKPRRRTTEGRTARLLRLRAQEDAAARAGVPHSPGRPAYPPSGTAGHQPA